MNILISNDDGINSHALAILVKEMSKLGDVYVVAPDCERSGNSHHFTYKGRIRIEERKLEGAKKAYAFWGTPCDCVRCGLFYIVKEKIDLVISGINKGWNVSSDMAYSGTVAAAREAFMDHIPSIAASLASKDYENGDFEYAAKVVREIAEKYVKNQHNKEYFLNVNVPDVDSKLIKGIMVCDHTGQIIYNTNYYIESEFGVDYVVLGAGNSCTECNANDLRTDIVALNHNYISVSPLYNDQINHHYYDEVKEEYQKVI